MRGSGPDEAIGCGHARDCTCAAKPGASRLRGELSSLV